jgi:SpoVK/Ycf46/Vps4 family AAA+-type ATPase
MIKTAHSSKNPVASAIAAQAPLIYVVSWEEERLAGMLAEASRALFKDNRPVWQWSAAQGFSNGPGKDLSLNDPIDALLFIVNEEQDAICLMKDLPAFFNDNPRLLRTVRDAYDAFSSRPASIIFSHPDSIVPPAVSREIFLIELPLPNTSERLKLLLTLNREIAPDTRLSDTWLTHIANAMQGLTLNESRDLLQKLVSGSPSDMNEALTWIHQARAQMLMKENCLEVVTDRIDIEQMGGLAKLKSWTLSRRQLFSKEARDAGIRAPSGILIMGVSGCGKSLAAKIIPSAWGLPLIRLDMNLIMSGGWGTPEVAWERALRAVENAAPVVLWIDELENSFGYMNDTITSGNMTIFSSFLTWMQEKPENVFVAATANKIEILPPEMIRKGRFDQLFFVDLPDKKSRIEILRIHFLNQGINPYQFDIDRIAQLLHEWTAAEIEQLIKSAQIDAFTQKRPLNYEDIIQNIYNIIPLSKTMAHEINTLRGWARDRATPAS